jgi:hypothetical protein
MKQGGLIMTCKRALCSEGDDKAENKNDSNEKVPLAPEANGKSADAGLYP